MKKILLSTLLAISITSAQELDIDSLLGDIERQLEHNLTGRYSANFRHAMG